MQGYNLVSHNAAISVAQSVLDAVGTALVLQCPWAWYSGTLTGVGIVSVANAAAACVAGLHTADMLTPHNECRSSCCLPMIAELTQGHSCQVQTGMHTVKNALLRPYSCRRHLVRSLFRPKRCTRCLLAAHIQQTRQARRWATIVRVAAGSGKAV